ncbi:MAG: hypothetical protein JWR27_1270 [Aeromicrobium sp.]|nr:hypothetical protein [Aeromicrobium sp.]
MHVTDPAGETWRIKRRWLPWRLRRRDPEDFIDFPGGGDLGDDLLIGLAIFIGLIVLAVALPVVLVLAVLVTELLLVLLLLPLFIVLRAGYVARWPIEVWRGDRLVHTEAVRGWSVSRRRMVELSEDLRLGKEPAPARRPHTDGGAV